ncbi:hypothetical protein PGC08_15360 [Brevibacterium sp. BDJS002]|uniref:hypothetical protein n=1 Tax=Brevibacterium sp. BDJS002 TaxID=3020906 RepID=UPI00230714AF|nr:hypothetical protein [Brevibacterium sp. BDJS002]WCE39363.1 hypothetical protein PGC08_15360 [Brevibacterium sp. BDJS002]
MIDMHMNHRGKPQGLEVGHPVIHVQGQFEVIGMVEGVERVETAFEYHGQSREFSSLVQSRWFAQNEDNSMSPVQFFEDRYPLAQLIELGFAIAEVDDDLSPDVAPVELVFELLPAFRSPDPFAGLLPRRRAHSLQCCRTKQMFHSGPLKNGMGLSAQAQNIAALHDTAPRQNDLLVLCETDQL